MQRQERKLGFAESLHMQFQYPCHENPKAVRSSTACVCVCVCERERERERERQDRTHRTKNVLCLHKTAWIFRSLWQSCSIQFQGAKQVIDQFFGTWLISSIIIIIISNHITNSSVFKRGEERCRQDPCGNKLHGYAHLSRWYEWLLVASPRPVVHNTHYFV